MESSVRRLQIWVLLQAALFYCTLYTDAKRSTNAVARHVSFTQITCILPVNIMSISVTYLTKLYHVIYIFSYNLFSAHVVSVNKLSVDCS